MRCDWEIETDFNRRLRREAGLTTCEESRKWRRRFFFALVIVVGQTLVILSLLPTHQ